MSARRAGDRPGQHGGSSDKDPAQGQLARELGEAINAMDPVPADLPKKAAARVVRAQRKAARAAKRKSS